jgi:hypothetical protein
MLLLYSHIQPPVNGRARVVKLDFRDAERTDLLLDKPLVCQGREADPRRAAANSSRGGVQ